MHMQKMWECARSTFLTERSKFNLNCAFFSFINQSNIKSKIYCSDGHYSTIFQHSCQIWDHIHFRLWIFVLFISLAHAIAIYFSSIVEISLTLYTNSKNLLSRHIIHYYCYLPHEKFLKSNCANVQILIFCHQDDF